MTHSSNKQRLLMAALGIAILGQCIAVAWSMRPGMAGDSPSYLLLAHNLGLGHYGELTSNGWAPDPLRPPGYPLLLWLLNGTLHLPLAAIVGLQVAAYLASLLLVERLLPTGWIRIIFRCLVLAYPFGVAYASNIMTEAWVMLCFAIASSLLVSPSQDRWRFAAVGGSLGAAILLRSDMLLLPVMLAVLLVVLNRKQGLWPALAKPLIMLAAVAAVLTPYALWNKANFGRMSPVPFAAAVGNSLYTASWQEELALDDFNQFYGGKITPRLVQSGYLAQVIALNRSIGAPELTPPDNPVKYPSLETRIASNRVFGAAAIDRIKANPLHYARHVLRNVWLLWNSSNYGPNIPPLVRAALMACSYAVFLLGIAGLFSTVLNRAGGSKALVLASVLLYPFAVHLPAHLEARYTSSSRPLLLLFAALGAAWIIRQIFGAPIDPARQRPL